MEVGRGNLQFYFFRVAMNKERDVYYLIHLIPYLLLVNLYNRFSKRVVCGVGVVSVNFGRCVKVLYTDKAGLASLETPSKIKK